jgi:hypothetical protein
VILALCALCALAGCGAPALEWAKPGAGEADLARDQQECRTEAESLSPHAYDPRVMGVMADPQDTVRLRDSCLGARGWRRVPR